MASRACQYPVLLLRELHSRNYQGIDMHCSLLQNWGAMSVKCNISIPRFLVPLVPSILCVLLANSSQGLADKNNLLTYRDPQGHEHPITNPADWDKRRAAILRHMQEVMGPLPDPSRKVPLDMQVSETIKTPHYVRKKLTYAAESNDRVPAFLLIPLERKDKLAAVLCLHQTVAIGKGEPVGLGGKPNLRY